MDLSYSKSKNKKNILFVFKDGTVIYNSIYYKDAIEFFEKNPNKNYILYSYYSKSFISSIKSTRCIKYGIQLKYKTELFMFI
jgi:hypothetical protein